MRLASLRPRPRGVYLTPALILLLALPAAAGSISGANPAFSYSTSGAIGSAGVSGFNAVSFQSTAAVPAPGPTSISLGDFQVAALPSGFTTSYSNTPFTITFSPYLNTTVGTPIVLQGMLNGSVNGSVSNIVATFTNPSGSTTTPLTTQFQAGNYMGTLTLADNQVPLSRGGNQFGVSAQIAPSAATVPEPTTLALLFAGLSAFGLRRFRGRQSVV